MNCPLLRNDSGTELVRPYYSKKMFLFFKYIQYMYNTIIMQLTFCFPFSYFFFLFA
jgi:hypothetical protein